MDKIQNFLGRLGIRSHKNETASKTGALLSPQHGHIEQDSESAKGKPAKKARAVSLEEKRKAAREHMRKLRAKRKAAGYTEAELERRREYNRKFMRKWRAK